MIDTTKFATNFAALISAAGQESEIGKEATAILAKKSVDFGVIRKFVSKVIADKEQPPAVKSAASDFDEQLQWAAYAW